MKKNVLYLVLCFAFLSTSYAQNRMMAKKEQVRNLKIGFITNELELTPDEAAKFWPIYNEHDNKQFEIRHKKIRNYLERIEANTNTITEKEAMSILVQLENNEDELYQLRKKLISNLKNVLPAVKIIKLKKAEDDFNKKLLEQYRTKRFRD